MTHVFLGLLAMALVLAQTTVVADLFDGSGFLDLTAMFVVYLAVFRRPSESCAWLLLAGAVMDSVSGGPFGLYISAYVWIFAGIWTAKKYLHLANAALLPLIATCAVFVENAMAVALMALLEEDFALDALLFRRFFLQLAWAAAAGPPFVWAIRILHGKWETATFEKISEYRR